MNGEPHTHSVERIRALEVTAGYAAKEVETLRQWVTHLWTKQTNSDTHIHDLHSQQEINIARIVRLETSDEQTREERRLRSYRRATLSYAASSVAIVAAIVGLITRREQGLIEQLLALWN